MQAQLLVVVVSCVRSCWCSRSGSCRCNFNRGLLLQLIVLAGLAVAGALLVPVLIHIGVRLEPLVGGWSCGECRRRDIVSITHAHCTHQLLQAVLLVPFSWCRYGPPIISPGLPASAQSSCSGRGGHLAVSSCALGRRSARRPGFCCWSRRGPPGDTRCRVLRRQSSCVTCDAGGSFFSLPMSGTTMLCVKIYCLQMGMLLHSALLYARLGAGWHGLE